MCSIPCPNQNFENWFDTCPMTFLWSVELRIAISTKFRVENSTFSFKPKMIVFGLFFLVLLKNCVVNGKAVNLEGDAANVTNNILVQSCTNPLGTVPTYPSYYKM